jgi:hypothetical protein
MKVLRSFNVHPIQIPPELPQNPSIAFDQCQKTCKELEKNPLKLLRKLKS